jgi:threonine/homoserine efflux transporter RhtA
VASMVVLGGIGTGIAYIWNTRIIRTWGATLASTVTYVTPVVGVTLGVLVLHETLHWNEPVGAALVILGILTSQGYLKGSIRTSTRGPSEDHREPSPDMTKPWSRGRAVRKER